MVYGDRKKRKMRYFKESGSELYWRSVLRPWLKTISLILIITFLSQQVLYGQDAKSSPAQSHTYGRIDLDQISIPRDIAITKSISKTDSKDLIINIKDVHDNFGAQASIVGVHPCAHPVETTSRYGRYEKSLTSVGPLFMLNATRK